MTHTPFIDGKHSLDDPDNDFVDNGSPPKHSWVPTNPNGGIHAKEVGYRTPVDTGAHGAGDEDYQGDPTEPPVTRGVPVGGYDGTGPKHAKQVGYHGDQDNPLAALAYSDDPVLRAGARAVSIINRHLRLYGGPYVSPPAPVMSAANSTPTLIA